MFVGVHVILAGAVDVPELVIDEGEGKQFMVSAQNVMRHYSVESSQKTIDWLAFGGTCAMIYGTRWGAYMMRKRAEKTERPTAKVYTMAPRPASAPQETQFQPMPEFHSDE